MSTTDVTRRPQWISALFGDVERSLAASLEAALQPVTLDKGEHLFEVGDPARELYILHEGKIKLSRSSDPDDHRRESLLTVLGAGEVFGELSVLDPGPRTTTATAITKCKLGRLDGRDLEAALSRDPRPAFGLVRQLARRLRHATDYAADLVLNDLQGRTARAVLNLADHFGTREGSVVVVPHGLTQQEIAHMVGASRESVNKVLMEFAESEWIQIAHRHFTITDEAALLARAEAFASKSGDDVS